MLNLIYLNNRLEFVKIFFYYFFKLLKDHSKIKLKEGELKLVLLANIQDFIFLVRSILLFFVL